MGPRKQLVMLSEIGPIELLLQKRHYTNYQKAAVCNSGGTVITFRGIVTPGDIPTTVRQSDLQVQEGDSSAPPVRQEEGDASKLGFAQ